MLLWKYLSSTGRPHFLPHTQVPYLKSSGSTTREGVFLPNRAVGRSEIPGGASSSEVGIICSSQLEIGICQKLRGYIAAPPPAPLVFTALPYHVVWHENSNICRFWSQSTNPTFFHENLLFVFICSNRIFVRDIVTSKKRNHEFTKCLLKPLEWKGLTCF